MLGLAVALDCLGTLGVICKNFYIADTIYAGFAIGVPFCMHMEIRLIDEGAYGCHINIASDKHNCF